MFAIDCKAYPDGVRNCFPFPDLIDKGVVVVKFWSKQDKRCRFVFTDDQLHVRIKRRQSGLAFLQLANLEMSFGLTNWKKL